MKIEIGPRVATVRGEDGVEICTMIGCGSVVARRLLAAGFPGDAMVAGVSLSTLAADYRQQFLDLFSASAPQRTPRVR